MKKNSRRFWRRTGWLSTLGLLLVVLAYFLPAPTSSTPGNVVYTTTWDWGAAQPDPAGGWHVVNDLGYEVHLQDGYIVTYSATLGECPHSHSFLAWLVSLLTPNSAAAGHNSEADPAQINASFVDSLAQPTAHEWGTVLVNEPSYCEGHYLVARADHTTAGSSAAFETSISITGTYQSVMSDEIQSFTLTSAVAWGTLGPLLDGDAQGNVHIEIGNEAVHIDIRRQLDRLFDGIDFATISESAFAQAVLRNLLQNTRFVVAAGRMHAP